MLSFNGKKNNVMLELKDFPKHLKTIKKEDWDKLFAFITRLEGTTSFSKVVIGEKNADGSFDFPHIENAPLASELVDLLYKMKLAPVFDYMDWKEGQEILKNNSFENLDAITVCKFFTVMLRSERFIEGFIAGWLSEGIVLKLLKRLQEIVV